MPGQEIFCPFELNHPLFFTSLEHSPFFFFFLRDAPRGVGGELPPTKLSTKIPQTRGSQLGQAWASVGRKNEREAESNANRRRPGGHGRKAQGGHRTSGLQESLNHWGRLLLAPLLSDSLINKKRGFSAEAPLAAAAPAADSTLGIWKRTWAAPTRAPHWSSRCVLSPSVVCTCWAP